MPTWLVLRQLQQHTSNYDSEKISFLGAASEVSFHGHLQTKMQLYVQAVNATFNQNLFINCIDVIYIQHPFKKLPYFSIDNARVIYTKKV